MHKKNIIFFIIIIQLKQFISNQLFYFKSIVTRGEKYFFIIPEGALILYHFDYPFFFDLLNAMHSIISL